MTGLLKTASVDLPISLTTNPKRISDNSLTPLGAQNKNIGAASSSLEKVLSVQRQLLRTVRRYSYGLSSFCCCSRNCHAKHLGTSPSYLYANYISLVTLRWRHIHRIVHKDEIDDFHEHLNRQNAAIQFTEEIEENGKIPFLDCLVTREKTDYERQFTENRHIPTDY